MITNPKVKSLKPEWAPFKGFSLIFDNPEPICTLYHELDKFVQENRQMLAPYTFCPLPMDSYHITLWDGLNDGNAGCLNVNDRSAFETCMRARDTNLLGPEVNIPMDCPMTFKVDRMTNWSNFVLVAQVVPADEDSHNVYNRLIQHRSELNDRYEEAFGFKPSSELYEPHISLGYFANGNKVEDSEEWIQVLNQTYLPGLMEYSITFESNSLYTFKEMAHFVKR